METLRYSQFLFCRGGKQEMFYASRNYFEVIKHITISYLLSGVEMEVSKYKRVFHLQLFLLQERVTFRSMYAA